MDLIKWDIYEVSADKTELTNVMFRGRIRKFGLENNINVLAENASDEEGKVRFAVMEGYDASPIIDKIQQMMEGAEVDKIREGIPNPVLSKLKVNIEDRYTL